MIHQEAQACWSGLSYFQTYWPISLTFPSVLYLRISYNVTYAWLLRIVCFINMKWTYLTNYVHLKYEHCDQASD